MLIHIVMHIDSFKELLALKVPRSWGSCEIRNTLVDPLTLIAGVIELPINVVVSGEHRIQSVGTSVFSLLAVPPSSACGRALHFCLSHFLPTLYCCTEVERNPFSFRLSVKKNFEENTRHQFAPTNSYLESQLISGKELPCSGL